MLDVRRVIVRPSLLALLQGRFEVGTLVLVRPTIVLEADADGKPNWEFTPGAGAAQPAGAPATGFHLAIGRLAIVRGTLSYTDPRTGKTTVAEQVRAQASVGSFEGPFTIAGTATVNGVPLTLDLAVGQAHREGQRRRRQAGARQRQARLHRRVVRIGSDRADRRPSVGGDRAPDRFHLLRSSPFPARRSLPSIHPSSAGSPSTAASTYRRSGWPSATSR